MAKSNRSPKTKQQRQRRSAPLAQTARRMEGRSTENAHPYRGGGVATTLPAVAQLAKFSPFTALFSWPMQFMQQWMRPWALDTEEVLDHWLSNIKSAFPKTETLQNDKEYLYRVELPEIDRRQIKLTLHNGILLLEVKSEAKAQQGLRRTRFMRSVRRAFSLPVYSDNEHIDARLKDGVLTVSIPKTHTHVTSPRGQRIIAIH